MGFCDLQKVFLFLSRERRKPQKAKDFLDKNPMEIFIEGFPFCPEEQTPKV